MKKTSALVILLSSIGVSAVLSVATRSWAYSARHSYTSCSPQRINQAQAVNDVWYLNGGNPNTAWPLDLHCPVDENTNANKSTYTRVELDVYDGHSTQGVTVRVCAKGAGVAGGGCLAANTSAGTGAGYMSQGVGTRWSVASEYAYLSITLPPKEMGSSALRGYRVFIQ